MQPTVPAVLRVQAVHLVLHVPHVQLVRGACVVVGDMKAPLIPPILQEVASTVKYIADATLLDLEFIQ